MEKPKVYNSDQSPGYQSPEFLICDNAQWMKNIYWPGTGSEPQGSEPLLNM